jgi:hypothetical protein
VAGDLGVERHNDPSDDAPAPGANSSYRSSDWSRNDRSDNYTAPTTGSSGSYT